MVIKQIHTALKTTSETVQSEVQRGLSPEGVLQVSLACEHKVLPGGGGI